MRMAGHSIAGMWVAAFWTGGLWAGLVGCGIAVDPVDLGSTMQAIGTCPSGVPSVSLASAAFLVEGKYSLDHALHVSPAGLLQGRHDDELVWQWGLRPRGDRDLVPERLRVRHDPGLVDERRRRERLRQ